MAWHGMTALGSFCTLLRTLSLSCGLAPLQDQLRALRELIAAAFGSGGEEGLPAVEIYDGDTPMGER